MSARSLTQENPYSEILGQPSISPQNGVISQRVKRKRLRVPVACFSCRALKTKCDGNKPVCSTCSSNGGDCQYSSSGISTSSAVVMVNQQYLHSLEERLAKLERGTTRESVGDHTTVYSELSVMLPTPSSRSMSLSNSDVACSNPSAHAPLISNINLNLTNTSTTDSPLLVSADPDVFMGGLSFTQLILNAMNGRTIGVRAQPSYSNRDESIPSSALFQLPNEARDLVDQFFKINHTSRLYSTSPQSASPSKTPSAAPSQNATIIATASRS
ncbi:hypothetical protein VE01_05251 [Pseudogymnoascus verrucosus]|uniref:Zn(2)-C6 fungal-type domain-containing protein n=1 Tax=Pseudogymnoascus verrucosus TaxID=342668 RepID=A0A1B8GI66_9PEZI|nr:uncharacterized protein VE01_05251 [Pseudogymnoascus verrucosus]OBT95519.1 hypothetical protein VE01_05251 [Pseudogymnoascus verrucosus]